MVDHLFVPSSKQLSVLYCRLTEIKIGTRHQILEHKILILGKILKIYIFLLKQEKMICFGFKKVSYSLEMTWMPRFSQKMNRLLLDIFKGEGLDLFRIVEYELSNHCIQECLKSPFDFWTCLNGSSLLPSTHLF